MSIVIKVENLSKQYRLGIVGAGTLRHDLNRWWYAIRGLENPYLRMGETNERAEKGNSDYVWALKDINFEVRQGEVLGVIGRNGAGKSTLLKILSRTTSPSTGLVKIKGRVASLLEVGTGFHPELTGRENVFLNGAILGMTRQEIRSKFDEIVDFAGVERYIDTPVKRYSSGMYVRLAFGVAAHLEPEILIVDEVLAVGDAEFQKKALGKMRDVSANDGRTVLFVSHNLQAIKKLCPNCIFMSKGEISYIGDTSRALELYFNTGASSKINGFIPSDFQRFNTGQARITYFALLNDQQKITNQVYFKADINFSIVIDANEMIPDALVDIKIISNDGNIFSHSLNTDVIDKPYFLDKGLHRFDVSMPNFLQPGTYRVNIGVHYSKGETIDYLEQICEFEVLRFGKEKDYPHKWVHGYIHIPSDWKKVE